MGNRKLDKEEVLRLLDEGCELWYFYMEGWVAVHSKGGQPISGVYCGIDTFLEIREAGIIVVVRSNDTGYPYYANNTKSQVYKKA